MTQQLNHAEVDVVIVGAGFSGLYAMHRFRDQMGLHVCGIEAASDVGGTWYWNRYPGARCDIESVHYSYSFSEELQQEWKWSERYAAQPDILAYLNHVADRFALRRDFRFNTRVTAMTWDDTSSVWHVGTDEGVAVTARFVILGSGGLSVPKKPEFPGLEDFQGELYATHHWPHEGVDLAGKPVGVIGTGASGIQLIPAIAEQVEHLTVFQRTANYATPLRNRPIDPEEWRQVLSNYPKIRVASRNNFLGIDADRPERSAKLASEQDRRERYDRYYAMGGFYLLISSYADLLVDRESNETIASYIRDRIAERVHDPAVAELLTPKDHPYGTKRPPMETHYYEAFNRSNVTLVDVKNDPIQAVTPNGVRTSGNEYKLDVLVLATGFDAFTGALLDLGITGRDRLTLNEKWADGVNTFLGIASHGFPNLFMIGGPQSAAAFYNVPLAVEDHVEFASDAIQYMLEKELHTIEPSAEAERDWVDLVNKLADRTLFPLTDSWWMGANIPGKPRSILMFIAGAPAYRQICADVVDNDYKGFDFTTAAADRLVT